MASIRKKSNGMWLAQVRRVARDGLPALNRSASFPRKAEAEAWAAKIENEWRTLRFGGAPNVPFSEVLERYKNEVSVHKHGWRNETNIINRVLRTPLAEVRLPHLSELQFQAWADERKKEVSTATLRREWVLLSNVLTVASKQWRWLPENFMQRLDKPADGLARTQRVTDEDAAAVAFAGGYTPDCVPSARTQRAAAAFYFALETAMRAGEIVMLTWDCVFYDRRYVHIPLTKNGHPRNVPLSSKAVAILRQMEAVRENAFVFNITSGSLDALFRKLKRRSLLENLHFHDARREALTRLAKIYSPMELAKISGHRDLRILLNTYYAPTVEDLAEKLEYPLQHPGAKLTTSLVMHGDVHGAGKSLLFEEIIKPMYGDYAATLGQSDLESNYTGNRSGKLFIIFEEIFNTKQKYDQTGAMKHMITGKTMRIERKFVDSYEEANHINCVFLSNEAQPFKIEENDRRYFVIWPKNRLPESLRAELEVELGADGILQFFMLLLSLPLTINYTRQPADDPTQPDVVEEIEEGGPRFDPHTKPPMTEAKANVINYGRYGWQTFFHELENGEIARGDIVIPPNAAARTDDMVRLYRWWCRVNNEREISRSKFLQHIASKRPRRKSWVRGYQGSSTARQFWVFLCPSAPLLHGEVEQDALGRQLFEFERAVDDITRAESV